ncbi:MAG TPA: cytochrome c family protein [Roseovarius sp.]
MIKTILHSIAVLGVMSAPAFAEGDAKKGERVFNKCKACHAVGDDAKNKVGPILNGVIGAEFGHVEDFKYSKALMEKAEEGLVWDEETLSAYLTDPKEVIPAGSMSFAGLRKEEDVANVIAFLAQYE